MSDETRSHRRYFPLPLPIHSTACGKREREVDELHSPQTARQTSRAPYSSFPHSFVRPPAEPIPSSRPLFKHAGARSGRQGWRVSATVRLVLDGREHDGMLMRHGARQVATAAPQSPRWYSPQKLSACSLADISSPYFEFWRPIFPPRLHPKIRVDVCQVLSRFIHPQWVLCTDFLHPTLPKVFRLRRKIIQS